VLAVPDLRHAWRLTTPAGMPSGDVPDNHLVGVSDVAEICGMSRRWVCKRFTIEVPPMKLWIHVDVGRAKAGPFGAPIAHGYLTLSLSNFFLPQIVEVRGFATGVNYGCRRR
jgi:hypothetical protein